MLHYNATWHGLCDKYRGGFGRYFLQGGGTSKGDEFLDHDEEWLLDVSSQLIKRTKTPPKGAEVGKQPINTFKQPINRCVMTPPKGAEVRYDEESL